MIGRLKRVHLREVWPHEAHDFTVWLQDNIDILSEVLNIQLTGAEREQAAGTFYVDLIAEDEAGNPVIIENQLGKSDHNHLGKLLTYLAAIEAKTAVWIVADPRPEHVGAIAWLNESSSGSFYLVKVEAVRIEDSPPAPLLTLIVGPSPESREVGTTKKDLAERFELRYQFWDSLLKRAKLRTKLHANISPHQESRLFAGAGKSGLSFTYIIHRDKAGVALYIDRGPDAEEETSYIFEELLRYRAEIEAAFGEPLEWRESENTRARHIAKYLLIGGYRAPQEQWPEIQDVMIDAMIRLEEALRPYIERL